MVGYQEKRSFYVHKIQYLNQVFPKVPVTTTPQFSGPVCFCNKPCIESITLFYHGCKNPHLARL